MLQIQSCQFHLIDSTGSIQNIRLTPLVEKDSLPLFTISIPSISFKGINDYSSYFNKKIDISSLQIQKPSFYIQAGYPRPKTTSAGIPQITSEMFLFGWDSLGVHDFEIINGSLGFRNNDEIFTVKNFDLSVDDFDVFSATEMVSEKFLFSNEVDVKLSQILYHHPSVNDSVVVEKLRLNSKLKELELEGIHLKIGQSNPLIGSIPSIDFSGVSFYDFTQNKKIMLGRPEQRRPSKRRRVDGGCHDIAAVDARGAPVAARDRALMRP
jgi:hypothetical protein